MVSCFDEEGEKKPLVDGPRPNSERGCTDILMLILFFICIVGLWVVAGVAKRESNTLRITRGTDYDGNLCGFDNTAPDNDTVPIQLQRDNSQLENIYYFSWTPLRGVCVETCPGVGDGNATAANISSSAGDNQYIICKYGATPSIDNIGLNYANDSCFPSFKSKAYLYRCLPDLESEAQ